MIKTSFLFLWGCCLPQNTVTFRATTRRRLVHRPTYYRSLTRVGSLPSESHAGTPRSNQFTNEDDMVVPMMAATAHTGATTTTTTTSQLVDPPQQIIPEKAAIGTINERLKVELEAATNKETRGPGTRLASKYSFDSFRTRKTDAEREAAIQEARNLNGVNPVVTTVGGLVALAGAYALWTATNYVVAFFTLHPIDSDFYVVERVQAVVRNVVIGLFSLASGFFGVTGMGILLLGIRVAYGVATGELDPTPLKKSSRDQPELPNVWELMLNKKPTRRQGKTDENNPFGL